MKKAIVFFHASQLGNNLHPFLTNEIELLRASFDEVHLICLTASCGFAAIEKYSNVHIHSIKLRKLYSKLWYLFPELFNNYFWKDLSIALKNHIFDLEYIKKTVMLIICGRHFAHIAEKIIKSDKTNTKWILESYWLTGTAYAVSLLKKRHPGLVAFSRLHSSEADYIRNKYAICQYKSFIDKYLDYVFFVCENAKRQYQYIINKYYNNNIVPQKHVVNYLGVAKDNEIITKKSSDGIFRILSCSRLISLKRVDMLAEVFSQWKGKKILWTHIGTGEDLDYIKKIINKYDKNNNCVLLGDFSNKQVLEYYQNEEVDVFINISIYEGLPVSIMEAMSYGIPIIATDVGGTRELVNTSDGILLQKDITQDDIQTAINSLIDMNENDYNELKKNAYKTYERMLKVNDNYIKLCKHINL